MRRLEGGEIGQLEYRKAGALGGKRSDLPPFSLSRVSLFRRSFVGLVGLLVCGTARAQETGVPHTESQYPLDPETAPRPTAYAVRATGPLRIDGRLDDAAWADARPISAFIQSQPDVGFPATERTVVRILYDDRNLYVGALCYDSMGKYVVTTLEYDFPGESTRNMDVFSITLDTFLDRRNSFIFLINPEGALRDGQTFNDSRQIDFAWRAVLDLKTTVHDSGWTVELAIPWTTLRFDPNRGDQQWGLNMLRRVRRKSEDSYWAPLDIRDPVHRMSKAGTLQGLSRLRAGRNLRVKPFVLGQNQWGDFETGDALEFDGGLDVKWGVTSGLTADGTFRTDFSQVEVDQEQVNLTRFPLFFPEQRDFFVENSGSFILGDVTERNYRMGSSLRDFTLFHSRRIGLSSDRRPVPIVGGARLTGRAGHFELGVLDMQTESFDSQQAENFGVLRLRRNLGNADLGAMFVNRQTTGGGGGVYNRSLGADANLRMFDHLIVNSYVARTEETNGAGDRTAARVSVAWRDRIWDMSGFVKHVGDGFNPAVGFVRRRGIRHAYATLGAHPRPSVLALQEINPYGEVHVITDLASDLLTRRGVLGLGVNFLDGTAVRLVYQNRFERLDEPFELGDVAVPVGRYDFHEARAELQTAVARPISGRVELSGGGFFDGHRISVETSALWRPHYRFSLEVGASRDDIELAAGPFSANTVRSQVRFAYSTGLFANVSVQYVDSNVDRLVVTNLRVNLIHAPLSDVFLVYTERRDLDTGTVERLITTKITKLFGF